MYQYCDKGGFGMGGGIMDGRFGLFIESDFWRGSSIRTECFENIRNCHLVIVQPVLI